MDYLDVVRLPAEQPLVHLLRYAGASGHLNLELEPLSLEIRRTKNQELLAFQELNLAAEEGESVTAVIAEDADRKIEIIAFDRDGNRVSGWCCLAAEDTPDAAGLVLHGNTPEPFRQTTRIFFDLSAAAQISLDVFDLLGRRVLTVPQQVVAAGSNRSIPVEAGALSAGVYFYRMTVRSGPAESFATGQMTVVW